MVRPGISGILAVGPNPVHFESERAVDPVDDVDPDRLHGREVQRARAHRLPVCSLLQRVEGNADRLPGARRRKRPAPGHLASSALGSVAHVKFKGAPPAADAVLDPARHCLTKSLYEATELHVDLF